MCNKLDINKYKKRKIWNKISNLGKHNINQHPIEPIEPQ